MREDRLTAAQAAPLRGLYFSTPKPSIDVRPPPSENLEARNAVRKVAFIERVGILPPGRIPRWVGFQLAHQHRRRSVAGRKSQRFGSVIKKCANPNRVLPMGSTCNSVTCNARHRSDLSQDA